MGLGTVSIGFTTTSWGLVDGFGSWKQYMKQRVVEMKSGKLISIHWGYKFFHKHIPKGKEKFIEQAPEEHAPRFTRAIIGAVAGVALMSIGFSLWGLTP